MNMTYRGMNTGQIDTVLAADHVTSKEFLGVFPADKLPKKLPAKRPLCLVANTDVSTGPGEHWVAFYLPKKGVGEFFDSGGNPPGYWSPKFVEFLNRHGNSYTYSKRVVQAADSLVCGAYAIYFVMCRARKRSTRDIVNDFGTNRDANDLLVAECINELINCE